MRINTIHDIQIFRYSKLCNNEILFAHITFYENEEDIAKVFQEYVKQIVIEG